MHDLVELRAGNRAVLVELLYVVPELRAPQLRDWRVRGSDAHQPVHRVRGGSDL